MGGLYQRLTNTERMSQAIDVLFSLFYVCRGYIYRKKDKL